MSTSSNEQPLPATRRGSDFERTLLKCWQEFEMVYPCEKDCVEALYAMVSRLHTLGCKNCRTDAIEREYGERIGKCLRCRRNFSFTAGTFFDRVREVRPWLAAIWFLEKGVLLSAKRFHELVGVAYSTAWMMHRKIALVIQSAMDMEKSIIRVSSQVFASAICKRSRETPAQKHPFAEQREFERKCGKGAPWASNFSGYEGLERELNISIRDAFHGISRKYLQFYIASFWCRVDRARWSVGRLLTEVAAFPKIECREVLSFVSPLIVKLIPVPESRNPS